MRVIGLSGGIATGKSTVTKMLRGAGLTVIDCDRIAHDVVRKGTWGYARVVRAFGPGILMSNGEIDREALGRIVFSDGSARRKLNAATHLPVALELMKQLLLCWLKCTWVVVVDMPLLFETGSHKWCSKAVVVLCDEEQQVQRVMARDGLSREDAAARAAAQMPLERKKALADITIDNSRSLEQLQQQVDVMIRQVRAGARLWGLITSPLLVAAALVTAPLLWLRTKP